MGHRETSCDPHLPHKPSNNQRSTTSRVASAAGRLRPNGAKGSLGGLVMGGRLVGSDLPPNPILLLPLRNLRSGIIVLIYRGSTLHDGRRARTNHSNQSLHFPEERPSSNCVWRRGPASAAYLGASAAPV